MESTTIRKEGLVVYRTYSICVHVHKGYKLNSLLWTATYPPHTHPPRHVDQLKHRAMCTDTSMYTDIWRPFFAFALLSTSSGVAYSLPEVLVGMLYIV
jgi:hypothetical protein